MALYGFTEIGILVRNGRLIPKSKGQNSGLLFIVLPFFATMFVSILEAVQTNHHWNRIFFVVGIILLLLGIFVRLMALIQIGKGFSVKIEKSIDQCIVMDGIYKYVRHPLYLASIIQCIGTITMLNSRWGLIPLPFSILAALYRIKDEEKFLKLKFVEYGEYAKRTRKLIPWVF
jgi:protein-S-isoprenylcysteine O-methyltransferase Ste14